ERTARAVRRPPTLAHHEEPAVQILEPQPLRLTGEQVAHAVLHEFLAQEPVRSRIRWLTVHNDTQCGSAAPTIIGVACLGLEAARRRRPARAGVSRPRRWRSDSAAS